MWLAQMTLLIIIFAVAMFGQFMTIGACDTKKQLEKEKEVKKNER
jgi:hypothetical protein